MAPFSDEYLYVEIANKVLSPCTLSLNWCHLTLCQQLGSSSSFPVASRLVFNTLPGSTGSVLATAKLLWS